MIWALAAVGLLILTSIALLVPRVRFSGRGSPEGINLLLSGVGFRIAYDSPGRVLSGRFLFFRIRAGVRQPVKKVAPSAPAGVTRLAMFGATDLGLMMELTKAGIRLAGRLLSLVRADYFRADILAATPDPLSTGVLFGALQPLTAFNGPRRMIHLLVDFERDAPRLDLEWSFSARPMWWLWAIGRVSFGLPWGMIWKKIRYKR